MQRTHLDHANLNQHIYEKFAIWYDVIYADVDYEKEAKFILEALNKRGINGKLRFLDLGCGTGSHLLEFAKMGHQVTGIDISPLMVEQAIKKFEENDLKPEIYLEDFRRFNLRKKFDVAISLYNSFGYALTDEDIDGFFKSLNLHLHKNSILFLEFWRPHTFSLWKNFFTRTVKENKIAVRLISWDEILDQYENIFLKLVFEVYILDLKTDRVIDRFIENHYLRSHEVDDIRVLLRKHGFYELEIFDGGGFESNWKFHPPSYNTLRCIVMAKKR